MRVHRPEPFVGAREEFASRRRPARPEAGTRRFEDPTGHEGTGGFADEEVVGVRASEGIAAVNVGAASGREGARVRARGRAKILQRVNLAVAAGWHDVLIALRQEGERVPLQVNLRQHGEEPRVAVHAEERPPPVVVAPAELT